MKIDQGRIDRCCDRIDLCGVSGAEDSKNAKSGKYKSEPVPVPGKSVFYVIHRTAHIVPIFVPFTKMNGQGNFREFSAHPKESRNPHPEYGAWSANGDGSGNAGDVSGSYCGGESGTDSLKWRQSSVRSRLLLKYFSKSGSDRIGKFPDLNETGPET